MNWRCRSTWLYRVDNSGSPPGRFARAQGGGDGISHEEEDQALASGGLGDLRDCKVACCPGGEWRPSLQGLGRRDLRRLRKHLAMETVFGSINSGEGVFSCWGLVPEDACTLRKKSEGKQVILGRVPLFCRSRDSELLSEETQARRT